jgi:hypothetical protein
MKKYNKFSYSDNDIEFLNRNNIKPAKSINKNKTSTLYDIRNKSSENLNSNFIQPKQKNIDNINNKDIIYYLSFYDKDWWKLV